MLTYHLVILLAALLIGTRCQCPHMAGRRVKEERPPSTLLALQATYAYHTDNSEFTALVQDVIRRLRHTLIQKASTTVDNVNVRCTGDESVPPCSDYALLPTPWNVVIVEDEKKGAAVYVLDEKLNGMDEAKVEAALLDVWSRHTDRDLTQYGSEKSEKAVGFVRQLSTEELLKLEGKKKKTQKRGMTIITPLLHNPIDKGLLQMRSTADVKIMSEVKGLREVASEEEMDRILTSSPSDSTIVTLLWSTTDALSTHVFSLFAQTVAELDPSLLHNTVFLHGPCHTHAAVCKEMRSEDLHQLVAYKEGVKVATLSDIRDVHLIRDWISIVRAGPLRQVQQTEETKSVKRGIVDGKERIATTLALFPSQESSAFRHLQMAADKLFGQFYVFYRIQEGPPAIHTYRVNEKKKRESYEGDFSPISIASFIYESSLPSFIDIGDGFSTQYLLRNTRPLLVAVCPSPPAHLSSLAHSFLLAHLSSLHPSAVPLLNDVLSPTDSPRLILFDKEKVWHWPLEESTTAEDVHTFMSERKEPEVVLSPYGVHPLRRLQLAQMNNVFGEQQLELAEDPSIFTPLPTLPVFESAAAASSGCPFMNKGATHEEL